MIHDILDKPYCFPFANVVNAAPSAAQDGTYLILTGDGTTNAQHQKTIALLRTVDTNHDPTIVTAPYGVCIKVSGFCVETLLETPAPSRTQLFEPPASVIEVNHLDTTGITSISHEIDDRTRIPIVLIHFSPETPKEDVLNFANTLAKLGVASLRTRVDSISPGNTAYALQIAATDHDALIKGGAQLTEAHIAAQVQSAQVDAKNLTRIAEHLVLLSLVSKLEPNGSFTMVSPAKGETIVNVSKNVITRLEALSPDWKNSPFKVDRTQVDDITRIQFTGPKANFLKELVSQRIKEIIQVIQNSDRTLFELIDPEQAYNPKSTSDYLGAVTPAPNKYILFFKNDDNNELVQKLSIFAKDLGYNIQEEIVSKKILFDTPPLVVKAICLARKALKIGPAPTNTEQPQPPGISARPGHAPPQPGG